VLPLLQFGADTFLFLMGAAKAGMAMASTIAAKTSATVNNINMRFISATLSLMGRRKKGDRPPPLPAIAT
jgi:hypothetical protein